MISIEGPKGRYEPGGSLPDSNQTLDALLSAILGNSYAPTTNNPFDPIGDVSSSAPSSSSSGGENGGGGGIPFFGSGSSSAAPTTAAAAAPVASTAGSAASHAATNALIGSLVQGGLGLLGGLLGVGQPQQRESFKGTSLDPVTVGSGELNAIKSLLNAEGQRASQGVRLRSTAPAVPGLSVSDPALKDPSLLEYPGLNLPADLFGSSTPAKKRTI